MKLRHRNHILVAILGIFCLLCAPGFAQNAHQSVSEHHDGHPSSTSEMKSARETDKQETSMESKSQASLEKDWPKPVMNLKFGMFILEQFEYRFTEGTDSVVWDAQGWYGGDYNRFWFKTEGEREGRGNTGGGGDDDGEGADGSGGSTGGAVTSAGAVAARRAEVARRLAGARMASYRGGGGDERGGDVELQMLYSRMIARFWDFQVGVRVDHVWGADSDTRFLAVVGFQGLAPYRFEVEPTLFISEDGDVSARLTATTDLLITQKLILQPRFETEIASGKAEKFGVGQGLGYVELGLRLRYELEREIAPYIGINWEKKFGETADIARDEGNRDTAFSTVVGIRLRF